MKRKKLTSIIVATIISTQFLFYQVSAVTIETNTTMETSSATIKEAETKNKVSIKDKANLKNKFVLDYPKSSNYDGKYLYVQGWILSENGIKSITAYIDNKEIGQLNYGKERKDVGKIYPEYGNSNCGFAENLDISNISEGAKNFKLIIEYNDGNKETITRNININRKNSKICIDSPKENSYNNENIVISGWALADSGVKTVNVYIDGKFYNKAEIGITRKDVYKVYPSYSDENSGYSLTIPTSKLSSGKHTLKICSISNDGKTSSEERSFYNSDNMELDTKAYLDYPKTTSYDGKTLYVQGWLLTQKGVDSIKAYIDNKEVGQAEYGKERKDVYEVYPQYKNSKAGYEGNVDIRGIKEGKREFKLIIKYKNGTQDVITRSINISRKNSKICIDSPKENSYNNENIVISGWALAGSGVKTVNVYIDGKFYNKAEIGITRKDVYKVYPSYSDENSGYSLTIPTSKLSSGKHTLKICSISNDGKTSSEERSFYNSDNMELDTKAYLDYPKTTSYDGKTLYVQGWLLTQKGVDSIKAYIDNKEVGQAEYGKERKDVYEVYPQYKNSKAGYEGNVDIRGIKEGKREFKLIIKYKNGTQDIITRDININRKNSTSWLDFPKKYSSYKDNLVISGWAIADSGIKGIHVYIDDKLYKGINTGNLRNDVYKVYPDYNDKNSGYSLTIPMSELGVGYHNVKVYAISYDDKVTCNESYFYNNANKNWRSTYNYDSLEEWRKTILERAFSLRGLVYDFGGNYDNINKPTNFWYNGPASNHFVNADDPNIPWNIKSAYVNGWGFDCAGFAEFCYMKKVNRIGHTTWDIVGSGRFKQISVSKAKPGDLFFVKSLEHVGIFLRTLDNGYFEFIDCNQTWENEEVGVKRGRVEVRRGRKIEDCLFYTLK